MKKTLSAICFLLISFTALPQQEVFLESGKYSFTFPEGWEVEVNPEYSFGLLVRSHDKQINISIFELQSSLAEVIMTTDTQLSFEYEDLSYDPEENIEIRGVPVTSFTARGKLSGTELEMGIAVVYFELAPDETIKAICQITTDAPESTIEEMKEIFLSFTFNGE